MEVEALLIVGVPLALEVQVAVEIQVHIFRVGLLMVQQTKGLEVVVMRGTTTKLGEEINLLLVTVVREL